MIREREIHVHQDTDKHLRVPLLVSIESTFALYTGEEEPHLSHGNKEDKAGYTPVQKNGPHHSCSTITEVDT